ncbi:MAG: hypothetical protein M3416_10020 [Acidobacteriota bacterium]|nr:hypothetical protein [Acidobacteriota bacterium]
MTAHKPAKKRKPGERVYPEPEPKLKLPKPGSECSTPELASELSQGLKAVLRKLSRRREDGSGDDTPGRRQGGGQT